MFLNIFQYWGFYLIKFRSSCQEMFCKKVLLKILLNSQENTCARPVPNDCFCNANSPFSNIDTTLISSSSHLMVFYKKVFLTYFAKFTRKYLQESLIFNEAAEIQRLPLSKKRRFHHRCFYENFSKFLITSFLKNPLNGCLFINSCFAYCLTTIFPSKTISSWDFSQLNLRTGNKSGLNFFNP